MATLKIGASLVLVAVIAMAAIAVNGAAGLSHAITIAVMGLVSLLVVNLCN